MPTRTHLPAILIVLLCISSCGTDNTSKTDSITDTVVHETSLAFPADKIPRMRNQVTDSMLLQIYGYYSKEYGADSIKRTISRSDTMVEVSFADTAAEYNGTLFIAYISLVTDIYPIVTGDLNSDGLNDMLVTVHTEGGGGGGNVWWSDHFLFLSGPNGEKTLADIKSDGEIMDGGGYFMPKEISKQMITGIGNAYADTDGRCCPSLYYLMHLRFAQGQLSKVDQTAIAKPAEFE
jgi:hypothetical protein